MSLNYLLDGYNIINRSPSLSQKRLEDSRNRLVALIEQYRPQGSENNSITVVFDGQEGFYGQPFTAGVRVIFTSGESADEKIKDMVSDAVQKKTFVVVTDDKEIKFFVRALGARVMAVDDFMALMTPKTSSGLGKNSNGEESKQISRTLETRINNEFEKLWLQKSSSPSPGIQKNFLRFVGTAGARFVTINQLRSSGGVWISYEGVNVLIDPGPGSLVKCLSSNPRLDPAGLDAIILTHKHIDHSNDINIMVEAMTLGGSQKRGKVFLPADTLDQDSIFIDYARKLPKEIVVLKEGGRYSLGPIQFTTPVRHRHTVETYGLRFSFANHTLSLIADTKYFPELAGFYQAETLIINTVFIETLPEIAHLSLKDAQKIINEIKPKTAVLTHFGRDIINQDPESFARQLTRDCGVKVVAAQDGMILDL